MSKPTFLGPLVGKRSRRHELVHLESGAVLASRVDKAHSWKGWRRGLTGRDSVPDDYALIVVRCRFVHTFFMRFPIDAIFVTADGTVIKACRHVKPWRLVGAHKAFAVIEASSGFVDRADTAPGDRVILREARSSRPSLEVLSVRPEEVPAAVREAVGGALPNAFRDTDSDADPWRVTAAEPPSVEPSKPGDPAGPPASEAPTVPDAPTPEPGSLEVPAPAIPPRLPAGPTPGTRVAGAGGLFIPESSRSVDLARLLARQTPLVWFEAVAIVQELGAEVVARGGAGDLRVPELPEIALTPEGGIELRANGPAGQAPVPRSARILLTLLAEVQTLPVQLRLLALEEVSPAPSCTTLQEFSTRLELFERPGRRAIVRGVYERFQSLPELEAERAVVTTPFAKPPVALVPRLPPGWWKSRKVQAGVGVAVAVLLVAAAVVLWPQPTGQPEGQNRRGPVTRAVSATADKVAEAASGGVRAVAQWLGLTAADRPTASPPAEPAVVAARPASAPARKAALDPGRPIEFEALTPEIVADTGPVNTDPTVYSAVNADTVPPQFIRPRLPTNPPAGVRTEDLPELEVVVSATGDVESVRLMTQPYHLRAAMMLSVVKNWRFQPAVRDGQPVRYRMRMRLTNQ